MKPIKIIVEKHPDGYVGYPLGLKGVVVGEGDTYEETLIISKSSQFMIVDMYLTALLSSIRKSSAINFLLTQIN